MRTVTSPLVLLALVACASVPLDEGGRRVTLLTTTPSVTDMRNLEELGTVACSKGANFGSPKKNIESCRNELRNKAAKMGADIVVVENQQLGTSLCANCMTLVGTAYKKKHARRSGRL